MKQTSRKAAASKSLKGKGKSKKVVTTVEKVSDDGPEDSPEEEVENGVLADGEHNAMGEVGGPASDTDTTEASDEVSLISDGGTQCSPSK